MDNECKLGHVYDPWNEENGRAKEIAYNNGFKDFDGPIKLSHDEERKCEINVQKEHAECENKNNDGLCIESVRLSGSRKNKRQDFYIDKIQEYVDILKKMSMKEDILKEMSLETRNEINLVMIKINNKIIIEAKSLKKSLYYL